MILEIPDALAQTIQNRALGKGMTLINYLQTLFVSESSEAEIPSAETLNYEEWRRRFDEFERTRRSDLPILTDEAISRESIYEGR